MTILEKLKQTTNLYDFAKFLGYKKGSLAYILYSPKYMNKYVSFKIPKRSGGMRTINAPDKKLKKVQKILSEKLQNCYEEIQEKSEQPSIVKSIKNKIVHGYRINTSIETNAFCHRNKRFVLNLDLDNFFPSINFGRVYGFFIKDRNFCLAPSIATIIAQISCYNNELPQGAPTSPVIANFITKILDIKLLKLAKKYNLTYTRYADDLTFSCNAKEFPTSIAFSVDNKWEIGSELLDAIRQSGFSVNVNKTRMQYNNSRQEVTGLIVNKKVNIKREYYKKLRAQCYSLIKNGCFYDDKNKSDINALRNLEGRLNFAFYAKNFENKIHKKDAEQIETSKKDLNLITGKQKFFDNKREDVYAHVSLIENLMSINKLYSMFLIYKHFILPKKNLILCEGKTDNIYIKSAIDVLKNKLNFYHPIKFIPHSNMLDMLTEYIGGTSKLKKFCQNYKKIIDKFGITNLQFPLIVIVDNDKAGKEVFNIKTFENTVSVNVKFMHPNLYIVRLPNTSSDDFVIENYFDDDIKTFEGKIFNPTNQKCSKTEFGKSVFATKVILKQKNNIDFSKFEPLLQEIDQIIKRHTTR